MGEDILIEAMILAVADAIEDLTSHRSYRNAAPLNEALKDISTNSGSKYDQRVVDACLRLFNEKGYKIVG
jgi:HD-GYP domain-containing protein (c-di-GMP phosphodiesterase class II)